MKKGKLEKLIKVMNKRKIKRMSFDKSPCGYLCLHASSFAKDDKETMRDDERRSSFCFHSIFMHFKSSTSSQIHLSSCFGTNEALSQFSNKANKRFRKKSSAARRV
jgi:hypothetical protein